MQVDTNAVRALPVPAIHRGSQAPHPPTAVIGTSYCSEAHTVALDQAGRGGCLLRLAAPPWTATSCFSARAGICSAFPRPAPCGLVPGCAVLPILKVDIQGSPWASPHATHTCLESKSYLFPG